MKRRFLLGKLHHRVSNENDGERRFSRMERARSRLFALLATRASPHKHVQHTHTHTHRYARRARKIRVENATVAFARLPTTELGNRCCARNR